MQNLEERRRSFDGFAEAYLTGRPRYPEGIYAGILAAAGFTPGDRALEMGCGPGIATRQMAEHGVPILALDLGENLIAVARAYLAGFPEVVCQVQDFNTWDPPEAGFAAIYAAQAWQWADTETGYRKAHRALRAGGVLAPFWNYPVDLPTLLQPVYTAHAPKLLRTSPPRTIESRIAERTEILHHPGLFEEIEVQRFPWTMTRSADSYIGLLRTYSDHVILPEPAREALFADIHARIEAHGGSLAREMEAVVYLCRRKA